MRIDPSLGGPHVRSFTAVCAALVAVPALALVQSAAVAADCTIRGTSGDDRLVGTGGRDVICGLGGDDVLVGAGGNDLLLGGGGSDVLKGGAGDDVLQGGNGSDTVTYAGTTAPVTADLDGRADDGTKREDDRIVSTENLVGGSGADTLTGDGGANVLAGGAGADDLSGAGGSDTLVGAKGDDEVSGGSGSDVLSGGPQDDVLVGGGGVDELNGGTGVNYCDTTAGETSASSCRYDDRGPAISELTTNKGTYKPGDELVVEMRVTDAVGVSYAAVSLSTGGRGYDDCGWQMARVSGTSQDGIWRLSCIVPKNVRNGAYEVRPYARDVMANWTNMNGQNPIDLRGSFEVVGGSDDADGPEIVSVSTDRASYAPGDELVVTMRVRDVTGVDYAAVSLRVGTTQYDDCGWQMTRVSGTAQDGLWELRCVVPSTMRAGNYEVYPYARDTSGNWTNMNGQNPIDLRDYFEVLP